MWRSPKRSWFSHISQKMHTQIPVSSVNYSSAGSKLSDRTYNLALDAVFNIKSMRDQVNKLLAKNFPDLILIWMGHNELNWVLKKEKNAELIAEKFRRDFQAQLARICEKAATEDKPVAIIVFGFIDIGSLFLLREAALQSRQKNKKLFPYFEKGYRMFPSIKPEHKEVTLSLAKRLNGELAEAAAFCEKSYGNKKLRIKYSDVLTKVSSDSLEHVTVKDGWHPSAQGQKRLAEAAWPVVEKQLSFLLKK